MQNWDTGVWTLPARLEEEADRWRACPLIPWIDL